MTAMRQGRPLRALLVLLAFLAGWLAGRWPGLHGAWQARRQHLAAAMVPAVRTAMPVSAVQAEAPPLLRAALPVPARRWRLVTPPPPMMAPPPLLVPMPVLVPAPATPVTPVAVADAAPPAPPVPPTAFALASDAYAALAQGRRAEAHGLFQAALAADPDNTGWRAADRQLTAHWRGEAFALLRSAGPVGPTAGPVLGGGQLGASLAFTPRPLARRPWALLARGYAATLPDGSLDTASAQAALGLRWQVVPQLSVTAERLLPLGPLAVADWNLRLAGGLDGRNWHVYAEAGALARGTGYAGGQARWLPLGLLDGRVQAGAGLWGGAQGPLGSGAWVGRLDAGPALLGRIGPATLEAGWRFRLAGNAAPGSGPAVVISAGF